MPILRLRADAGRIPLADGSVHCVATSPPYFGLRKYAGVPESVWGGDPAHAHEWGPMERGKKSDRLPHDGGAGNDALNAREFAQGGAPMNGGRFCACGAWRGCLGNEPDAGLYVAHLVECFRDVRRVLRSDGVCWVVLGDSFSAASTHGGDAAAKRGPLDKGEHGKVTRVETGALRDGIPAGNLLGVPWRVALSLQADGWLLRNDVVWAKTSAMPESVRGWSWRRCRVKVAGGKRGERMALTPGREESAQSDHDGHDFAPSAEWADCPGCAACTPTDGLVLRRGSWRHTRAHESVFMLAKSMNYFCDAEAVKLPHRPESLARYEYGLRLRADGDAIKGSVHDRINAGLGSSDRMADFINPAGANPRSFMLLGPEPLREAHYAAMPTALVEPLLLASTSARGVCRVCGAPWARVVERAAILERPKSRPGRGEQPSLRASLGQPQQGGRYVDTRTHGFRATCACSAGDPVPATVLDPFAGSGTTGIVAVRHRRRAVLCDLSQTYLRDIADARTRGVQVELAL